MAGRGDGNPIAWHADRLTSDDIIEMNGLRVTSVARTLVDLCRTQPYRSAVVVADHVLHHRLTTTDLILAALESQHHRRGMPGARRALAFADGRAESPGESRMRLMFEKCGFALPELQVLVLGDNGKVLARADAADLEDNCLYEYDGRVKYSDPFRGSGVDALMDEKRREDLVRSHGRAFCRLTADDLSEEIFRARVERARAIGQSLAASGAVRGRLVTTPARTLPLS